MHDFTINTQNGLLLPALQKASPHHDERPAGMPVDLVVIHGISLPKGEFGSGVVDHFFCGTLDMSRYPALADIAYLRVASHLLIKRDGEVVQFVPFSKRAWHAGESCFQGRAGCNDFSIGIEMEGTDDIPYEEIQYQQLGGVIRAIMQAYPEVIPDRIVGHVDIAPGRKTDPGPVFNWAYLKGMLL